MHTSGPTSAAAIDVSYCLSTSKNRRWLIASPAAIAQETIDAGFFRTPADGHTDWPKRNCYT